MLVYDVHIKLGVGGESVRVKSIGQWILGLTALVRRPPSHVICLFPFAIAPLTSYRDSLLDL